MSYLNTGTLTLLQKTEGINPLVQKLSNYSSSHYCKIPSKPISSLFCRKSFRFTFWSGTTSLTSPYPTFRTHYRSHLHTVLPFILLNTDLPFLSSYYKLHLCRLVLNTQQYIIGFFRCHSIFNLF